MFTKYKHQKQNKNTTFPNTLLTSYTFAILSASYTYKTNLNNIFYKLHYLKIRCQLLITKYC